MVYAYKCNGRFRYTTTNGPQEMIECPCGETHELEITTFEHEPCMPNVVPDTLPNEMDWGAGRKFPTRTERKKYYKEHGLHRMSRAEKRRSLDCTGGKPLGPISYKGQKYHGSRV